jgi:hypothetical protein
MNPIHKFVNTIWAASEAIDLRLSRKHGDDPLGILNQMGDFEKFLLKLDDFSTIIKTLNSKELRYWVTAVSSVNYGKHLLDEVFPRSENSDDYHSRNGIVYLNEHPVQVLGWEDYEVRKKQGIDEYGLEHEWISVGFEKRANERGIDLESSFHGTVSGDRESPRRFLDREN